MIFFLICQLLKMNEIKKTLMQFILSNFVRTKLTHTQIQADLTRATWKKNKLLILVIEENKEEKTGINNPSDDHSQTDTEDIFR